MLISFGCFMLVMFLAALRFSADTIMYLHQLSKCCRHSRRFKLIHFWLNDSLNCQYRCSGPHILLIMQDEKSFTQLPDVAGSMSLLVLIIKAPNETNTENDVPKLIFCT